MLPAGAHGSGVLGDMWHWAARQGLSSCGAPLAGCSHREGMGEEEEEKKFYLLRCVSPQSDLQRAGSGAQGWGAVIGVTFAADFFNFSTGDVPRSPH